MGHGDGTVENDMAERVVFREKSCRCRFLVQRRRWLFRYRAYFGSFRSIFLFFMLAAGRHIVMYPNQSENTPHCFQLHLKAKTWLLDYR